MLEDCLDVTLPGLVPVSYVSNLPLYPERR